MFFKLKAPRNVIAGFGFFAHYSTLPVSMAWEVYGVANGAPTFEDMRGRLLSIRSRFRMETDARKDFWIGCILVNQPTFFHERDWISIPADWSGNIVQGKGYDVTSGEGERIWLECLARARSATSMIAEMRAPIEGGYGASVMRLPRVGQKRLRIGVLDGGRCALTPARWRSPPLSLGRGGDASGERGVEGRSTR